HSGNSILTVGDEIWIYHGRWMNAEKFDDWYHEIAVATLPRDRWGALGLYADAKEGSVWTAPFTLNGAGSTVSLNAQGLEGMRVEISDGRFGMLPGFSGDNAGTAGSGDHLGSNVTWPKGNLDVLAGRKIRLLIHLARKSGLEPRLFAAYVGG